LTFFFIFWLFCLFPFYFIFLFHSLSVNLIFFIFQSLDPLPAENRLAGVVSIGGLVKAVISDREIRIQQLESDIAGG
jgi:hypothetical protein